MGNTNLRCGNIDDCEKCPVMQWTILCETCRNNRSMRIIDVIRLLKQQIQEVEEDGHSSQD